jgi:hypothetical protein
MTAKIIAIIIVCFTTAFIFGCARPHYFEKPTKSFPVKIGMLADSQMTTRKGSLNYGMRRKRADIPVEVSIRPAALEYLAPEMLEYFLLELEADEVDVILYLGDGANSGCRDELDTVFEKLEQSRSRSDIPSYYLIGNHDYLGAGNQVKLGIRENLCDRGFEDNLPETKSEVIARINTHNIASSRFDNNFIYEKFLGDTGKGDLIDYCYDLTHFNQYYAGILKYRHQEKGSLEILLADTSDYRDVDFKPTVNGFSRCEGIGAWGLKGSMSYKEKSATISQIDALRQMADDDVDYRIMASHYQPKNFNILFPFNISPSLVRDRLGDLLSDGSNYWLSGHTHAEMPDVHTYKVGKTFTFGKSKKGSFLGLNVGSTTDYYPNALVVEKSGNNTSIDEWIGYRVLEYPRPDDQCEALFAYAEKNKEGFRRVCDSTDITTVLGLDKAYRKNCWTGLDVERVRENITALVDAGKVDLQMKKKNIHSCLAIQAVINEEEL